MNQERRSFKNRLWRLKRGNPETAELLQRSGANPFVARVLATRGVEPENINEWVDCKTKELMPNPLSFKGMKEAIIRTEAAILNQEKITIYGDYDVDGATSSSITARYLRAVYEEPDVYIPDRILEGYGPNSEAIRKLKEEGTDLLVIVDSGSTAFEPLETAREIGLDVIVIDHHACEDVLPPCISMINPNRKDQDPGYGHLCAAGVAFIFCIGLNMRLKKTGFLTRNNIRFNVASLLDIVALGTVCDVVPLTGLNRAFVIDGLKLMNKRQTAGINALAEIARLDRDFTEVDCGFVFGPRINAGGRIGESGTGARLLLSDDYGECYRLATRLDNWNRERQTMEKESVALAHDYLNEEEIEPWEVRECLTIPLENAHEGVVGIVSSRIKDSYDAPNFVFSVLEDGNLKGSGRSVPGFHLGEAVIEARNKGIVSKGGGHAMAAGLSLPADNLDDFKHFMDKFVMRSEFGKRGMTIDIDLEIKAMMMRASTVDSLSDLAPFGQNNPKPLSLLRKVFVKEVKRIGENGLKLVCKHGTNDITAIDWNAADTKFGNQLEHMTNNNIDLLGKLEVNEFNGKRYVQLKIEDARPT